MLKTIKAGVLEVAYLEFGPEAGPAVVLLHGFPYDAHAFTPTAERLVKHGYRVYVPFLRGFGKTRFLSASTPRSGQQAALAHDTLAFIDALGIEKVTMGGFDWGGRIAALIGILCPERVRGVVLDNHYPVQDIATDSVNPADPSAERRYWYQYYLHSERGRLGLEQNRNAYCRLLWEIWSPTWTFDEALFTKSCESFDNPDFVDIAVHSYRHRYRLAPDDANCVELERKLQNLPSVPVPCTVLIGADDGVEPPSGENPTHFSGGYRYQVVPGCGHILPFEAPEVFANEIIRLTQANL